MTYQRVLPRDLFNEANLLKCYGQLWLLLERFPPGIAELSHWGERFQIEQDPADGSLFVYNLRIKIRGLEYLHFRPLNSRDVWPLYLHGSEDDIPVFNAHGDLSDDLLKLIHA